MRNSLENAGMGDRLKITFDEWNLRAWQHPGFPRNAVENYEDPEILNFVDQRIKENDLASQYTMADALFAASFFNACLRQSENVNMAMYSNLLEDRMAEVKSISGKLIHDNDSVAVVDAIATVDKTGSNWAISLINRHPLDHVDCTVKMGDKLLNGTFKATVLTCDSPDSLTIVHVDWQ